LSQRASSVHLSVGLIRRSGFNGENPVSIEMLIRPIVTNALASMNADFE